MIWERGRKNNNIIVIKLYIDISQWIENKCEYDNLEKIKVTTNKLLSPAQKNYESVGFILYDTKENNDEAAFSGDYLYYKIQLQ